METGKNTVKVLVVMMAAIMLLAGCTAKPPAKIKDSFQDTLTVNSGESIVVVHRVNTHVGMLAKWVILVDGNEMGEIKNGTSHGFIIPNGAHTIQIKNHMPLEPDSNAIEFTASSKEYFFLVGYQGTKNVVLSFSSEAEIK